MARDCRDSLDNRFMPITWKPEYVEPPYADFYKDGSRWVPELDKMTGYESIPSHFPVVVEEYWTALRNFRRVKAQYRSQMMGKEIIDAMIPELPELKAIQPERRFKRFKMAKAFMLNEDRMTEITERCKREREEEEEAIREMKKKDNITATVTADAVAQLPQMDAS
eukprot:5828605-Amphidinium_carterae.1